MLIRQTCLLGCHLNALRGTGIDVLDLAAVFCGQLIQFVDAIADRTDIFFHVLFGRGSGIGSRSLWLTLEVFGLELELLLVCCAHADNTDTNRMASSMWFLISTFSQRNSTSTA